ncbi:MAG: DEAD/DEAH box helicase [Promethearchaeota archaeon]|nr:MAG: DEAD/DEAH box helicase [Candidatus Lokiarchaeota archaeon]
MAQAERAPIKLSKDGLWIATDINMREYQQKIVDRAQMEHILVVIPTGVGKTLIGAKLMQYCMEVTALKQKAIFLAPTRPLIGQHVHSLQSYFNSDVVEIHDITGKVSPDKRTKILTSETPALIVMTPQTLNNDIAKGRYDLKNVCLIIFDEAHRAQGDYAYVPIADHFVTDNPQGRILALTASPGSTQEKIAILLNNLHIPLGNIEYRDRQHKEVKPYTHEITTTPVPVKLTPLMTEIYAMLEDMKNETLEQYGKIYLDLDPNAPPKPDDYYLSTIIKQMKFLTGQINHQAIAPDRNPKTLRTLLSMNARINKIYHLMEYVESQGLENVRLSLEKMGKKIDKGTASHADVFLFRDYRIQRIFEGLTDLNEKDPEQLRHPKQFQIRNILQAQFSEEPEARILIFTKYRDTVRDLVKFLKVSVKTCLPSKFVGQSSKTKQDAGMSQKSQLEILGKFRNGEINTLVATNVAEEGLDIAECSMVIMYDTLASEIRMIQRAGRTGRSSAGEIKVLFTKGTADERKWYIAQARTKRMKKECNNNPQSHQITKEDRSVDKSGAKQKTFLVMPKQKEPIIPKKAMQEAILIPASSPPLPSPKYYMADSLPDKFKTIVRQNGTPKIIPNQEIGFIITVDNLKIGFDFFSLDELTIKSRRALFLSEIQRKHGMMDTYHCFLDGTPEAKSEVSQWVEIEQHIEVTLGIKFHFYLTTKTAVAKFHHLLKNSISHPIINTIASEVN